MDFSNTIFLTELNSARKRINPSIHSLTSESSNSTSSNTISTIESDCDELLPLEIDIDNDPNNNYINLDSLSDKKSNSKINIEYIDKDKNKNKNNIASTHETDLDHIYNSYPNYRLVSVLEKINKTIENNYNRDLIKKNNCFYTSSIVVLSSVSIIGLIILNDFILLNYFI
jgi:hypothetical protein